MEINITVLNSVYFPLTCVITTILTKPVYLYITYQKYIYLCYIRIQTHSIIFLLSRCTEEEKFSLIYALLKLRLVRGKTILFVNNVDRCYK